MTKYGHCKCGCGEITNICRGKHRKFIIGHHTKNVHPWNYGMKMSKAFCKKCKEAQTGLHKGKLNNNWKGKCSLRGEDHPFYGKSRPKKVRNKISKSLIGKVSGENHYNWQGGLSFEPYCKMFNNTLRRAVRKRDHYTCQRCGKKQKKHGKRLCVHHIHFDKGNCYPDLITLCSSCHLIINFRRNGSEKRFMKNLKERNLLNWCSPNKLI